jgi:type IX secretion system PorP/SprF family membrane protein
MPYPIRYLIVLLGLINFSDQLQAQDPFFSQFYANRVYLNPAYAGLEDGTQLTLNYRDQWFGLPDASSTPFQGGFRTMNATVNQRIPCFGKAERANLGVAASFFKDATGNAPFTTTGFSLAGAFEFSIIKDSKGLKRGKKGKPFWKFSNCTNLEGRLGFQMGARQSSLSANNLIYSFQLDPVVGLGMGSRPMSVDLNTGLYSSLNIGGMLRAEFKQGVHGQTIATLGASISNVNQPEVSLFEGAAGDTISRRYTIHAGFATKLVSLMGTNHYSPLFIAPQFRWDSQNGGKLNLFTMGSYFLGRGFYTGLFYQFNTPNVGATNGGERIGGRNSNAFIFNVGVDLATVSDTGNRWSKRASGWIVGFSYDLPVSGINADATLGSVEISCRILLHQLKKTKCSVLGKRELYKGATCPVTF